MFKFRFQKDFKGDLEPHEIFLDSLAKKREAEFGLSEKKFEVPLVTAILQGFFIFCFLIILVLFAKTFQLQVIEGKTLTLLSEENKFTIQKIRAERGVIYDQNLKQLVFNQPRFDLVLYIDKLPQEDKEKEKILGSVANILQKDIGELEKQVAESKENVLLVVEDLSHEALILLESKIKELPGFEIENNTIRYYPEGEKFSQLIGYTGKIKTEELRQDPNFYSILDYVGRAGIEKSYEEILRKNPGEIQVEKDAQGNVISKEIIQSPESGESLVLWLDSDLQNKIQEELDKKMRELGAKGAVGLAMDPKTGGILSLVSLPSFDNNLFQKGADLQKLQELLSDPQNINSLFNRAIAGKYLTGSTIKPLIASGALEEKIIPAEKKIDCEGKIVIQNPYNKTSSSTKLDWTTHGRTDLRKAIAESCNVYFYTVGGGYGSQEGLGPTKIKEYLELFGWAERTGIDLPGETAGFLPDKSWKKETWKTNWWDGDTYNLAIGQGFLQITPLEVVNAFAAIANGGILYQPKVAKEIVDSEKNVIQEFKPEIIRENFIDPANLQIVREGMRQAVTGQNSPQASAVLLNSLPVAVAAKTGTAELGNNYYHNWITVFAPYDDPQIVLTLLVENVKGVQAAVLPVAKAVLEWYFNREK